MKNSICLLLFLTLLLGGCSAKQRTVAWQRTKTAAVNAATDGVTWTTLGGAVFLYATPYDTKLTDYFRAHPWTSDEDNGNLARAFNGYLTIGTAVLVPEARWEARAERVLVEAVTLRISRLASYGLESGVRKKTPDGRNEYAIGSNHALPPFTGSALTRRNVANMELPPWAGYSLVGISYLSAATSALVRVEDGGHSVGDQLISASIGNAIGLFFHDLFLLDDGVTVQAVVTPRQSYFGIAFRY
jgi:hypothetical protein